MHVLELENGVYSNNADFESFYSRLNSLLNHEADTTGLKIPAFASKNAFKRVFENIKDCQVSRKLYFCNELLLALLK